VHGDFGLGHGGFGSGCGGFGFGHGGSSGFGKYFKAQRNLFLSVICISFTCSNNAVALSLTFKTSQTSALFALADFSIY